MKGSHSAFSWLRTGSAGSAPWPSAKTSARLAFARRATRLARAHRAVPISPTNSSVSCCLAASTCKMPLAGLRQKHVLASEGRWRDERANKSSSMVFAADRPIVHRRAGNTPRVYAIRLPQVLHLLNLAAIFRHTADHARFARGLRCGFCVRLWREM